MVPTWVPKWSQNGPKIHEKSIKHLMFFWMVILVDFGWQNGAKLAPKSDPKSMSTSKGVFSRNALWLQRGLVVQD